MDFFPRDDAYQKKKKRMRNRTIKTTKHLKEEIIVDGNGLT